jgi:hypothetical protein
LAIVKGSTRRFMSLRSVTGPSGRWVGSTPLEKPDADFRQNDACSFDISVYKQSVWLAMWG